MSQKYAHKFGIEIICVIYINTILHSMICESVLQEVKMHTINKTLLNITFHV